MLDLAVRAGFNSQHRQCRERAHAARIAKNLAAECGHNPTRPAYTNPHASAPRLAGTQWQARARQSSGLNHPSAAPHALGWLVIQRTEVLRLNPTRGFQ